MSSSLALALTTHRFLITGDWFSVLGILGDCRDAFSCCQRQPTAVTGSADSCCWRDCTMLWLTPIWLFAIFTLPVHAAHSEGFGYDSERNMWWIVWTIFVNVVYVIFTLIFACKPCLPEGHDAAGRASRLTGKVVDKYVCASLVVFALGLLFSLIAFTTTKVEVYIQCCDCVDTHGDDEQVIVHDDNYCGCWQKPDGTLVENWEWDAYQQSLDPNYRSYSSSGQRSSTPGAIKDGGGDMYDTGNWLSTSLCSETAGNPLGQPGTLSPYTTGMNAVQSDCFGPDSHYRMDLRESMMFVVSKPTAPANGPSWTFTVNGNLGADGDGHAETYDLPQTEGGLRGYAKVVCSGHSPSITHLTIVEAGSGPTPTHQISSNTDQDFDEISGIPASSGLIYIMAAKEESAGCPSRTQIAELFDEVVTNSRTKCSTELSKGCNWGGWTGPVGEAALEALEEIWNRGGFAHRIQWDLGSIAPPPPPPARANCDTPGVGYRLRDATQAARANGDYYYHESEGYVGRFGWHNGDVTLSKDRLCGQYLWLIQWVDAQNPQYTWPYEEVYEDVPPRLGTHCWSPVGTSFDTPPEVGWQCFSIPQTEGSCNQGYFEGYCDSTWSQSSCEHRAPVCEWVASTRRCEQAPVNSGLRLRPFSFCVGDDMNTTTSACPEGDQDAALEDASGALWPNCASAAHFLDQTTYQGCHGTTPLRDIFDQLISGINTDDTPVQMAEAGLDPNAKFADVCCETCPPPPQATIGTYSPNEEFPGMCRDPGFDCCAGSQFGERAACAPGYVPTNQPERMGQCPNFSCVRKDCYPVCPPAPAGASEPWQQTHGPQGIHPSTCADQDDQHGATSGATVFALLCINAAFFLMASFAGCCCTRLAGLRSGRCSMCAAVVASSVVLAIVDFFGFIMLVNPQANPPEVVYTVLVLGASFAMLIMFNARHCSVQAPRQPRAAVTTAPMINLATPATPVVGRTVAAGVTTPVLGRVATAGGGGGAPQPVVGQPLGSAAVSPLPTVAPQPQPEPSPNVPSAHVSAAPSSAAVMPSIVMPTTGFSLESEPNGAASG